MHYELARLFYILVQVYVFVYYFMELIVAKPLNDCGKGTSFLKPNLSLCLNIIYSILAEREEIQESKREDLNGG